MAEQTASINNIPQSESTALADLAASLEQQRLRACMSMLKSVVLLLACLWIGVSGIPMMFDIKATSSSSGEITAFLGTPMAEAGGIAPVVLIGWPLVWLIGGFWQFRRWGLGARWKYINDYKRKVLGGICRAHFPTMAYQPGVGMDWRIFEGSTLFAFTPDEYSSEDRFSGKWGSTDVAFAEAVAQRQRKRFTLKGFETVTETYFRGLIFIADFHKHFQGTTRLIPQGEKGAKNRSERRAQLESPHFEAVFETWTSNQVEVRYLLSTSMLERFVELERRFPKLRARFHDESLLLLLPSSYDRFEPSLLRRAGSQNQYQSFIEDLDACLSVVDELNLNTRIWSKV